MQTFKICIFRFVNSMDKPIYSNSEDMSLSVEITIKVEVNALVLIHTQTSKTCPTDNFISWSDFKSDSFESAITEATFALESMVQSLDPFSFFNWTLSSDENFFRNWLVLYFQHLRHTRSSPSHLNLHDRHFESIQFPVHTIIVALSLIMQS